MLNKLADWLISWIGSTTSIAIHTLFFIFVFGLRFIGISFDSVLLILTTVVSLEAIYLSLLIQRSVNQSSAALAEVAEDIEDVTEDLGEITEDIEEIQEDIDDIQEEEAVEHKPSKDPVIKQIKKLRTAMVAHEQLLKELEKQIANNNINTPSI